MLQIIRAATESDFDDILDLQSRNLYTHLSSLELAGGFVMTPFTLDLLRQLLDRSGVFVAEDEHKIVGYLLAGDWEFFSQWEIFRVMVARLPELRFRGEQITSDRSFQYGPICIDRASRGSDIFPQLFELMRSDFAPQFPIGVTFINKLNQRSFAAHTRKLDLEIIDEFEFNGHDFYTLAFLTEAVAGEW
ncbi:GNAT family acetyltransferase [Chamaesiphon sp.]|uniref:GNAT family acetyltransferase n=1 Tax=Chamaesiphon sp. TaxID=2814140 RepID=UPI00359441F3